jgi:hypothetical protein
MGFLAREKKVGGPAMRQAMLYGTVMASFCVEDFSLRRLATVSEKAIDARVAELRGFLDVDGPSRKR